MLLSESISEIGLMIQGIFKTKCHDQCHVSLPGPCDKRLLNQQLLDLQYQVFVWS